MKLSGRKCQCPTCKEYFKSEAGFDKHRVGSFENDTRRCMTREEMEKKKMMLSDGFWIVAKNSFHKISSL